MLVWMKGILMIIIRPHSRALAASTGAYNAPVGEMEQRLADIWSELLQVEKVSFNDDFLELGGHSLPTVQLKSRLNARLGFDVGVGDLDARPVRKVFTANMEDVAPDAYQDPLPPLDIQYADFALWQHQWLEGLRLQEQLAYRNQQPGNGPALYVGNDTYGDYPQNRCIHQLFEEQVQETPGAVAVVYEDEHLTYTQLNKWANRLAHHLMDLGVGPEQFVAIMVERGVEMMVAVLAVLKAGGAIIPMDPSSPEERLAYILEDSQPRVLLTQSRLENRTEISTPALFSKSADMLVIFFDLLNDALTDTYPSDDPDPKASGLMSANPAYMIYTSGPTARPKAVCVKHKSAVNLALAQ